MFGEAMQKKLAEVMEQQMINSLLGTINQGTTAPATGRGAPQRSKICYGCGKEGHYKNDPMCPIVQENTHKVAMFEQFMGQQQRQMMAPAFHQAPYSVAPMQVPAPMPPPPPPPAPPAPLADVDKKIDAVLQQVQQLATAIAADRVTLRRAEQNQAAFEGTTAIALKETTAKVAEVVKELKMFRTVQVSHAQVLHDVKLKIGMPTWAGVLGKRPAARTSAAGRRAPASAPPARRGKGAGSSSSITVTDEDEDEDEDALAADTLLDDLEVEPVEEVEEGEEATPATAGGRPRRLVASRKHTR